MRKIQAHSFGSEPGSNLKELDFPAFPVLTIHKTRGIRIVRGTHVRAVPFELVADSRTKRDTAEQDALGQIRCDIEVRVGRCAAFHHREPLLFHGEVGFDD